MIYKLENRKPVPCTFEEYTEWVANENARECGVVAQDNVGNKFISTVFLSADVSAGFEEPQLFETAVFIGPQVSYVSRYPTWEAAEEGHQYILESERGQNGN